MDPPPNNGGDARRAGELFGIIGQENDNLRMNKAVQPLAQIPEDNISNESANNDDRKIEQIIGALKNNLHIPKRKDRKSLEMIGRPTEVVVNAFEVNLDKFYAKTLYQIQVLFSPNKPKNLLRLALEAFNLKYYAGVKFVFDGEKYMYTVQKIDPKYGNEFILNEENNKIINFTIFTTVENIIEMNVLKSYLDGTSDSVPTQVIEALNIVLKTKPSLRFLNFKNTFYPIEQISPNDLGNGTELWKGFIQTPILGWKTYLNIDVTHKKFLKTQPVIDYIKNELGCDINEPLSSEKKEALLSFILGLKVNYMIPNQPNSKRIHKIVGLFDTATNFSFQIFNPNDKFVPLNINVVDFFKYKRNYHIKYPNLPCLHVDKLNKKFALPIELCTFVSGQTPLNQMNKEQMTTTMNVFNSPTDQQNIKHYLHKINDNHYSALSSFGIDVKTEFATIPARVLDQPSLVFGKNEKVIPKEGVWRLPTLFYTVKLEKWAIINLDQCTNMATIKNFELSLISHGNKLNFTMKRTMCVLNFFIKSLNPNNINELTKLFEKIKEQSVQLVMVIIPDDFPDVYATVKQISELKVGILTQCIKSRTISQMVSSYITNILLKMNLKLNGINHSLHTCSSLMEEAIIFGANVSYAKLKQNKMITVATIAASYDLVGCQYNMKWHLQGFKVEFIQDIENIVFKQLILFKEKTNVIPKKIIFFREGVGHDNFHNLLDYELMGIRRACLRLSMNYMPSVIFLAIQKRHHLRLFSKSTTTDEGTMFGNVPTGTIVDTQITHPTETDFYLSSHASKNGTSKPTNYHLIWDDLNSTENQLEKLTFHLCFMNNRARSISYPAPAYYAYLAAYRAGCYLKNKDIDINRLEEEQLKYTMNTTFTANTPMFYI